MAQKFKIEVVRRFAYVSHHEVEADTFDEACTLAESEAKEEAVVVTKENEVEDEIESHLDESEL